MRKLGALLVTVMALAACGSDDDTTATDAGASGGSTTSSEPDAASPAAALEGTWRTEPISLADAEKTLRAHGLEDWIVSFRANAPFEDGTVLILDIGEEWDLYGQTGGAEPVEIDYDAAVEIDGGEVTFTHSDGANTYRWQVQDDTLMLEFVESTLPDFEGVPEEVYQRALYMTSAFTRDA
jgi:hypothetical protein